MVTAAPAIAPSPALNLGVARGMLTAPAELTSGSLALDLAVGIEAIQRLMARAERLGATVPDQVRAMPRVLLGFGEILGCVEVP